LEDIPSIQVFKLNILYNLIRKDPGPAFNFKAMEVLTKLLQEYLGSEVAVWTSKCIMVLAYVFFLVYSFGSVRHVNYPFVSFLHEAKVRACELGTLDILTRMLWERTSQCRAAVSGAIMM
jgi:hypothetical protein